jgi:fatty-acid desaturase
VTTDSRASGRRLPRLPITVVMVLLHAGAVAALFDFSWSALAAAVAIYWIAGGLGVGIGYHRLLTHRGFKVAKPLEYALAVCGTLALQGGPIWWVVTHRVHHAFTDVEGDPHSPRDGAWWSHMGWILRDYTLGHDLSLASRYAPDLASDRFYVWLTRFHLAPPLAMGALLYALGGPSFVLWGVCACLTVLLHATWLVNSAAHLWGTRRYDTRDDSRNSWWVAMLTFGEGWHNNHHARPAAARHGHAWYEVDVNWWCIRLLERAGIASAVRTAPIVPLVHPSPAPENG